MVRQIAAFAFSLKDFLTASSNADGSMSLVARTASRKLSAVLPMRMLASEACANVIRNCSASASLSRRPGPIMVSRIVHCASSRSLSPLRNVAVCAMTE
jgi:hypothetical protein